MSKKLVTLIFLIIVAVVAYQIFMNTPLVVTDVVPTDTHDGESNVITYNNATNDQITVDLPFPGAVVGKDFSVIGKARGGWFFEASFPVQLLDENGNVLVSAPAQAEGEWMTSDFVPFKADLRVPASYIGRATLVLMKDNASGEPERDASISFPITVEY